jgi:hypothetical protein
MTYRAPKFNGWARMHHGRAPVRVGVSVRRKVVSVASHCPPLSGGGASTVPTYFWWTRLGNILSIEYREDLNSGSWQSLDSISPVVIQEADSIVIGLGEAGNTESSPVTLISFYSSPVPEPGAITFTRVAVFLFFRRRHRRAGCGKSGGWLRCGGVATGRRGATVPYLLLPSPGVTEEWWDGLSLVVCPRSSLG